MWTTAIAFCNMRRIVIIDRTRTVICHFIVSRKIRRHIFHSINYNIDTIIFISNYDINIIFFNSIREFWRFHFLLLYFIIEKILRVCVCVSPYHLIIFKYFYDILPFLHYIFHFLYYLYLEIYIFCVYYFGHTHVFKALSRAGIVRLFEATGVFANVIAAARMNEIWLNHAE